jgi:drug/metabolite transporter (DMT)-like permease
MTVRASALNHASAEKSLFYQLAGSAPLLALLALPGPGLSGQTWNLPLIGLLAYQCLMVSFVSMLLWYWMMRHYPASQMSAFTLTTPGFGLIAGVLLLGEPLTLRLILALATIAAGLMLINRRVLPPA